MISECRVKFVRSLVAGHQCVNAWVGVDLPQQPGDKAVARDPPDLGKGDSAPVASGTLEKQPFSLPHGVQLRGAIRAGWHGPKLAGIARQIQCALRTSAIGPANRIQV